MAEKNRSLLKKYHTNLSRQRYFIPCSLCKDSVLLSTYEQHCFLKHSLNSKLCCVWCRGALYWEEGCKSDHANHLLECLREFIAACRIAASTAAAVTDLPPSTDAPQLMNLEPLIQAKVFWKHADGDVSTFENALDHFNLLETHYPSLPCQDTQLNLALSYVDTYLETYQTHDWIQVMVKLVAFPSFVRALHEYRDSIRLLRFSCWCDGGKYSEERHRQHRHCILRAEKGAFPSFWSQVVLEDPADKPPAINFPCKRSKKIDNAIHFVNLLGYLSKRESQCNFSVEKNGMHHFYIFEPLPVDFRRALVGRWNGGILELLKQELFDNISVARVTETPLIFHEGQWKQKIRYFYNLPKRQVLPVEKRFAPTTQVTAHFYCLTNGRKLYFEEAPENELLSEEQWLSRQVQGGNCFYDGVVGEEIWIPRPQDQERLNEIMPYVHQIQQLNQTVDRNQRETDDLKREVDSLKREKDSLKREKDSLKRKQEKEVTGLKRKHEKEVTELKNKLKKIRNICNYE